jgi:hypothetical protein
MPTELYFISYDRENEQLSKYGDTKTARSIMLIELKKLIEANPLFRDKLAFPTLKSSRLRTLINQRYVIKQVKAFYWFSLFLGSHVSWCWCHSEENEKQITWLFHPGSVWLTYSYFAWCLNSLYVVNLFGKIRRIQKISCTYIIINSDY